MSTKLLRNRTVTSIPVPRRRQTAPSDRLETTEAPVRMYSDVVASRPPSPRVREENSRQSSAEGPDLRLAKVARPSTDVSDDESSSEQEDGTPWITVQRKRARSLDSAKKSRRNKNLAQFDINAKNKLSTEQETVIKAATEALTKEQREHVVRRQDIIAQSEGDEVGMSRDKGKTIDPREWGNSGIVHEELDPDVQGAIFDTYENEIRVKEDSKKKKSNNSKNRKSSKKYSDSESESDKFFKVPQVSRHRSIASAGHARMTETRRAGSRPVTQIAPKSSLGVALNNIALKHGNRVHLRKSKGEDSTSPSESSSDSESSDNSDNSKSTRSHGSYRSKRRHNSKRHHKRNSRERPKKHRTSIKPIPPKDYDGSANPRSYHRFVMEGEAYLRDGKVHKERQIRILAHHLDGKAYDFYMQKVASDDPHNWSLHKFFTELFNYCFPIDYRQQMRMKLEDLCQGSNQTVSEYVHELQELFSMIGAMSPELKVLKLWYTLRPRIQKIMWKDGLHPDISTWDEIVAKAEVIEIADQVVDPRERKMVQMTATTSNTRNSNHNNNNFNNKNKNSHTTTSTVSRSMSYVPKDRDNSRSNNGVPFRSGSTRPNNQERRGSARPHIPRGRFNPHNRNYVPRNSIGSSKPNSTNSKIYKPPKLSKEEEAELRAAGKCFNCKEVGHISRNCPHLNSVKGNGGTKPPGIPSYNMEMTLIEDNSDPGEVLESMPVGVIEVKNSSAYVRRPTINWRKHYPIWQQPTTLARNQIGDCYEIAAEYQLTISQPYPGDETWTGLEGCCPPDYRFEVRRLRKNPDDFRIKDRLTNFEILVNKSQLTNLRFNLGNWYAKHRAQVRGLQYPIKGEYHAQMENPLVVVSTYLLRSGVHTYFPNVNPDTETDDRFFVYLKDWGSSTYIIVDADLNLKLEIEQSILEDPKFDLISWYLKYVTDDGNFYEQYMLQHKYRYQPIPEGEEDPYFDMPRLVDFLEDKEDLALAEEMSQSVIEQMSEILERCQPYPGDSIPVDPGYTREQRRFILEKDNRYLVCIYDRVQGFETYLSWDLATWHELSLGKWFAERCAVIQEMDTPWEVSNEWIQTRDWWKTTLSTRNHYAPRELHSGSSDDDDDDDSDDENDGGDDYSGGCNDRKNDGSDGAAGASLLLGGVQVDRNKYTGIQRNAARVKNVGERILPKPVVIRVEINGSPTRALVDSGSLGDFMSSTLVDQLHLKRNILEKAIGLLLAVQGSRSKINTTVTAHFVYQGIDTERSFDVANLSDYDMILGTPWIYQHKVLVGLNPARIVIGSDEPLPLVAGGDTKYLLGATALAVDDPVTSARTELLAYAEPLCRKVDETELPPFRAINHSIPLIDEGKTYQWRPSRCPEIFRKQWAEKRDAYLKSGRWKVSTARNTVPMLLIPKPHKPKDAQELRTVIDLRERNKNTVKLSSPLPDIEGVLRRVAAKPFKSVLDLTAAYEQIRIIPEHVERSAVTTPDGNMVSLVLQMGDCNAPATYQSLMNHIFSPYLGRFLDVYLDDIIIYSDDLEDHVKHCRLAMDVLKKEKLYLSKGKIRFLQDDLKLLGRVIDVNGIRMDPEKVDSVLAWKTPTNRDLLRGFIGSVGYLADDIPNIRLPLGVLSAVTGDTVPFRWGYTEQRAFDEAKRLTEAARMHSRRPISYKKGAPQVWMVTDGCATGVAGVVSQGIDWKTAKVAAFYSAKLNNAQRNYPVHEIEMLAGIETMLRHKDVLQGVHFKWVTDHKGLIYLLNQKAVSGRQARWLEKISSFVFEVVYAAGSENVLADALSRMYSNDSVGTDRTRSEFTMYDVSDDEADVLQTDMILLAGMDAVVATHRASRSKNKPGAETGRPETSKEFAQRMKDKFVLRGPQKQTEGESSPTTHNKERSDADHDLTESNVDHDQTNPSETSLVNVILESDAGMDLLKELRGHYQNDSVFKSILEDPKTLETLKS